MQVSELFSVTGYGAVVTGGASGLGLAFTEVLAENGARVTMIDFSAERLAKETQRLRAAGFDVRGAVVDVTDRPAVYRAVDEAVAEYGRLDVVFANAGIDSGPGFVSLDRKARVAEGAIENYDDARWNKVIETNLNSVFTTIKAAARHMKPRKSGRIIVTTSVAGLMIEAGIGAAYMAAKAGAAHLMRTMALELARYNILVNASRLDRSSPTSAAAMRTSRKCRRRSRTRCRWGAWRAPRKSKVSRSTWRRPLRAS